MTIYPKKIYEQVRELIVLDAQDKPPGSPLDTEIGYAKRFGVSRPTVRKAVEDLIAVGMIRRIAGKGLVLTAEDEVPNRGKLLIALPQSPGDGFYYRVMMGCVDQANRLGFDYKLLSVTDVAQRLELIRREKLNDYVAAITCCYNTELELEILSLLKAEGLPVLLMDNPVPELRLPCVGCNDYAGGYMMGQYLVKKGHRNILNITSNRPAMTIQHRDEGFFDALANNGVPKEEVTHLNYQDFEKTITAEDIHNGKITAICSHTSLMIVGIANWLYKNGLRIYDDISVIGYGDHPYLPEYGMPITAIEVPSKQMGIDAVNEVSQALLEHRPMRDVIAEVWLEKRHTVKDLNKLL